MNDVDQCVEQHRARTQRDELKLVVAASIVQVGRDRSKHRRARTRIVQCLAKIDRKGALRAIRKRA